MAMDCLKTIPESFMKSAFWILLKLELVPESDEIGSKMSEFVINSFVDLLFSFCI